MILGSTTCHDRALISDSWFGPSKKRTIKKRLHSNSAHINEDQHKWKSNQRQGITTGSFPIRTMSNFKGSNEEIAVYQQPFSRQGGRQQSLGSSLAEASSSLGESSSNEEVAVYEQQDNHQGKRRRSLSSSPAPWLYHVGGHNEPLYHYLCQVGSCMGS